MANTVWNFFLSFFLHALSTKLEMWMKNRKTEITLETFNYHLRPFWPVHVRSPPLRCQGRWPRSPLQIARVPSRNRLSALGSCRKICRKCLPESKPCTKRPDTGTPSHVANRKPFARPLREKLCRGCATFGRSPEIIKFSTVLQYICQL